MAAAGALSLRFAVNLEEAPILLVRDVVLLGLDRRDRRAQHLVGGRMQFHDLLRLQRGPLAQWQQTGLMEDLICVGVADPGDERLVAQQVLQLTRMPADSLREFGKRNRESIWAELGPTRDRWESARYHPVNATHLHRVEEAQFVTA